MSRAKAPVPYRSSCPISCTLDIIGDKWTLLVLRDLFLGKRRYKELQNSEESIPTNLLAERLARLQGAGLVSKVEYQSNPPRHEYRLTAMGLDLGPALGALAMWGKRHLPGVKVDRTLHGILTKSP